MPPPAPLLSPDLMLEMKRAVRPPIEAASVMLRAMRSTISPVLEMLPMLGCK